jgi:ketosteroid isomerase-like protein
MKSPLFRLAIGSLICTSFLSPIFAAEADQESQQKAAIEEVGNRFVSAVKARDVQALAEILADDFFATEADGSTRDKQQYIERLTSANSSVTKIEADHVNIRIYEGTAVEPGRVLNEGSSNGRRFESQARYTIIYVQNDGRWQPTVQQVTLIR